MKAGETRVPTSRQGRDVYNRRGKPADVTTIASRIFHLFVFIHNSVSVVTTHAGVVAGAPRAGILPALPGYFYGFAIKKPRALAPPSSNHPANWSELFIPVRKVPEPPAAAFAAPG